MCKMTYMQLAPSPLAHLFAELPLPEQTFCNDIPTNQITIVRKVEYKPYLKELACDTQCLCNYWDAVTVWQVPARSVHSVALSRAEYQQIHSRVSQSSSPR